MSNSGKEFQKTVSVAHDMSGLVAHDLSGKPAPFWKGWMRRAEAREGAQVFSNLLSRWESALVYAENGKAGAANWTERSHGSVAI